MTENGDPRVFLSYSWSSTEYVERVTRLAEALVNEGIDVEFDQWSIREGEDLHTFMERAVNDPTIDRVLVLCDPRYAEKADGRAGGVGKETLILSPEVYARTDQHKVVPVIVERDESGMPPLPTYLKSRYFLDLSDPTTEAEQFVRLVRNIYGKPASTKPPLGRRPAYVDDQSAVLKTGQALRVLGDALHRGQPTARGHIDDYLSRLESALADLRVPDEDASWDSLYEGVSRCIAEFEPYFMEFVDFLRTLSRYGEGMGLYDRLHRFFERAIAIRMETTSSRVEASYVSEHIGYITWELLLHTTAQLIEAERFQELGRVISPFSTRSRHDREAILRSVDAVDYGFEVLDRHGARKRNLREGAVSFQLLRDRAAQANVSFEQLLEADLVLWLRSALDEPADLMFGIWYPRTIRFHTHSTPRPLFLRARSARHFARFAEALGVSSADELRERLQARHDGAFPQTSSGLGPNGYANLINLQALGSAP